MNNYQIIDGFDRLRACTTLDERWSVLGRVLGAKGYDQLNFAVLNLAGEDDRETAGVTQYSTMDPGWIEYYLDRRLDLDDPHVRFVRDFGFRPYFFDETRLSTLDAPGRAVLAKAADAGLRAQISVIFPDTVGSAVPIGGMTIGTSRDPADFHAGVRGHEQDLLTLAMLFHSLSLGEVRRAQLGIERLSPRERDVLAFVAAGHRGGQIAHRLAISEATVELHLRNARRKLRAATTAQAVARALLTGAVTL